MGYQNAIVEAKFVEVKNTFGVHYDTFASIKIDQATAISHFSDSGVEFALPEIGTTINI